MSFHRYQKKRDEKSRGIYWRQMQALKAERHIYWKTMSTHMLRTHAEDAFNKAPWWRKWKSLKLFNAPFRQKIKMVFHF